MQINYIGFAVPLFLFFIGLEYCILNENRKIFFGMQSLLLISMWVLRRG